MSLRPWTQEEMASRVAERLRDGSYVNLGIGMPTLVSNFVPAGREMVFQCENGIMGIGPHPAPGEEVQELIDAGSVYVTLRPGAAIVSHDESFAIIRGGHLDVTVLGAFQVSENGDLASWLTPGQAVGGMGGAMDLARGARAVYVMMRHQDKEGRPKIVRSCSYPLTAPACVKKIFTDLAVIDVEPRGLVVREMAEGLTLADLQAITEPTLRFEPEG
ncbi:MAG: 3-oxoacid CoA-transferase subunit B [Chloroflexota bacterium]